MTRQCEPQSSFLDLKLQGHWQVCNQHGVFHSLEVEGHEDIEDSRSFNFLATFSEAPSQYSSKYDIASRLILNINYFKRWMNTSQSRNSWQNPPENRASSEATTGKSSCRRRGKIRRFLGKVKNATKKICVDPEFPGVGVIFLRPQVGNPVLPNFNCEGASSIPDINLKDAPPGAEQGADPKSALQNAKEAVKLMKPLSEHLTSGASTVQNASADLEAAYNFQDTYLQPLRILMYKPFLLVGTELIP
ncbi:hypothetical protein DFJ58DRAFT_916610 [Suillus subalutaceus]|uniref:uncharacterized protein n=1 Tax=Suillus subalutaceus TaxID=48586 RepID=UPI001B863C92|nr:uncharacterized protein DFJ58DRAFT_916610 [Suillus subalutaceus]KAG1840807.1 hypothetical protein DFJ58DRAFT_916610 [Suillus subalutaceus]